MFEMPSASAWPCGRSKDAPRRIVLANLAEGRPRKEIMRSHPSVTLEHIHAALAYAADLAQERVLPLPA